MVSVLFGFCLLGQAPPVVDPPPDRQPPDRAAPVSDVLPGPVRELVEIEEGRGAPLAEGDRATVSFQVLDPAGKELANSDRRGLAFTLVVGSPLAEPALGLVVPGMRLEGERRARISSDVYGALAPNLVPPGVDLTVRVKVLGVVRKPR
jgi:hypothetical protein